MKKYYFLASFYQKINFLTEGIQDTFTIVDGGCGKLLNFQDLVDSSLKEYNMTRSGSKKGVIYGRDNQEIGTYEIKCNLM